MFRKPRTGTWELLEKYHNGGTSIDLSKSFYCGDAAGRIKANGKKDFSSSDRLFALNVGLRFLVPEEVFLKQKSSDTVKWPEFNPKAFKENVPPLLEPQGTPLNVAHQEVILMVGVQGSGKSYFAEKHLRKQAGYVVISNDKTGGREKSLKLMKKALSDGKSVVIDNTHVNPEARQKFVDLGKWSMSRLHM